MILGGGVDKLWPSCNRTQMGNSTASSKLPPVWAAPEETKASQFKIGDKVQYYSETHTDWVDCYVVGTKPTGCVQVDCKPGYWIPLSEQATKVRFASTGSFTTILPFQKFATHFDTKVSKDDPTSSIIAEAGSLGSLSSLSSLIFSAKGRSVGFDPGVAVVAFKENTPAAKLGRIGRTYECNLESAVSVPPMWSFASGSSAGPVQKDVRDGALTAESDWLGALSSIPEGVKQPPSTAPTDLSTEKQGPTWLGNLIGKSSPDKVPTEPSTPPPHSVSIGIQVDESHLSGMLPSKSAELDSPRPSVGTWCPKGPVSPQSPQWFNCCCGADGSSVDPVTVHRG